MTTIEQVRLPPGSLGLELEPKDRDKSHGLRVKGWGSNVFSLQCLAPQTEIVSVDGIEVKGMNFREAVALLRASKTRSITYVRHDTNVASIAPAGEEKLVATLRFQDIDADKENSPMNTLSPVVSRDFWTTAKRGKKTRSPLKLRGVNTSPKRRFGDLAGVSKAGDEWVCIPLAEQFNGAGSPHSRSMVYEEPPVKDAETPLGGAPTSPAPAPTPASELLPEKEEPVQSTDSRIYPRVTPLKEEIRELKADAHERQGEVEKLASEVGNLRSSTRGSDGAIALLKFQLSKSRGMCQQAKSNPDTIEQSQLIVAHLKMSRILRALSIEEGAGVEPLKGHTRTHLELGAERANLSSGTLHDSASESGPAEEQKIDLSSGTLCDSEGGVHVSEAGVQSDKVHLVDGSAQCEIGYTTAHAESSIQCDLGVSVESSVPASSPGQKKPSQKEASYLTDRVLAQEKFIGLLRLQMHSYVDTHLEVLRQSVEATFPSQEAPDAKVRAVEPSLGSSQARVAKSTPAPMCEPLQSFPLVYEEGETEEGESKQIVSPIPSHSGSVEGEDEDVRAAFQTWQATKGTPADVGLTPRAFKEHLQHIRGSNAMAKDDVATWRKHFAELKEEVDSYRL